MIQSPTRSTARNSYYVTYFRVTIPLVKGGITSETFHLCLASKPRRREDSALVKEICKKLIRAGRIKGSLTGKGWELIVDFNSMDWDSSKIPVKEPTAHSVVVPLGVIDEPITDSSGLEFSVVRTEYEEVDPDIPGTIEKLQRLNMTGFNTLDASILLHR